MFPQILRRYTTTRGFTLIELSIVLVIIGLVVGGILVGRDLIAAAAVRGQISQIEQYQQAVNTFRGKYGYIPGDIPDPEATQFGFTLPSYVQDEAPDLYLAGNGNGLLDTAPNDYDNDGWHYYSGEGSVFMKHLVQAKLITSTYPEAKIGRNGHIAAWSGGWGGGMQQTNLYGRGYMDGKNYFAVFIDPMDSSTGSASVLTVKEAYAMDSKMDDGLPQTGRVLAMFPDPNLVLSNNVYSHNPSNWSYGADGGGVRRRLLKYAESE